MNEIPRIIVADDDDALRSLIRLALEGKGIEILEAANGQEAVALFLNNSVDLVLLDIHMPVMNGYDACLLMREKDKEHTVPIVMVTGQDDDTAITQAFLAGADEFVNKPINWLLLAHQVDFWINSSRAIQIERRQFGKFKHAVDVMPDTVFHLCTDGRVDEVKLGELGKTLQWQNVKNEHGQLADYLPASLVKAVSALPSNNGRLQLDVHWQDGITRRMDICSAVGPTDGMLIFMREIGYFNS